MRKKTVALIALAVIVVVASICLCLFTDAFKPGTGEQNPAPQNGLSAEDVRKHIRESCNGTFADAKNIFEKEYAGEEFRLEYFFTDKELKTIQSLENNGENRVYYETYDKGWVEIESLIGEVGDEVVYIGEQDPFVENFVWE